MPEKPLPVTVDVLRAAISMIPVFGSPIEILLTSAITRDLARVEEALNPSIDALGSPELLREALANNERLEVLFAEGMRAASSSSDEAKRRLLGRVLRTALEDDARVDESEVRVIALRDLWPVHVRALARLRDIWDSYTEEEQQGARHPLQRSLLDDTHAAWRAEPLSVTAVLVRTGTARPPLQQYIIGQPITIGISPFGIELLDDLAEPAA